MHSAARPVGDRCGASLWAGPELHLELPGVRGIARHAVKSVRRFFIQITLLWVFTQLAGAAITLWLLLNESVERFVVAKSVVSLSLTLGAIALSALWFRRSMARHGIPVRWRPGVRVS